MKRHSTLVIREMQIETIMRYHFTCTKMVQLEQTDNTLCWQGCAVSKILIGNGSMKRYNHFGKLFNGFL